MERTKRSTTLAGFLLIFLLAKGCFGQVVPVTDCCLQAKDFEARYLETKKLLDQTRTVGQRIMRAKESRISALQKESNARLETRRQELLVKGLTIEQLQDQIMQKEAQIEQLEAENAQWVPKTKAGVFIRKVRNGLAVVGGGTVVAVAYLIAR